MTEEQYDFKARVAKTREELGLPPAEERVQISTCRDGGVPISISRAEYERRKRAVAVAERK